MFLTVDTNWYLKILNHHSNNNSSYSDMEKEVIDYIDVLADAAKQRNPQNYDRAREFANCIYEMINTLRKHNINKIEEVVHALVAVIVIPIQIIETDKQERYKLMREISEMFVRDIIDTHAKDIMMEGSEVGNELEKLRYLSSKLTKTKKQQQRNNSSSSSSSNSGNA